MSDEIPTPRTDAASNKGRMFLERESRTLERELATALRERDEAREYHTESFKEWCETARDLREQLSAATFALDEMTKRLQNSKEARARAGDAIQELQNERDTLKAKLADAERERNSAHDRATHNINEELRWRTAVHVAKAQFSEIHQTAHCIAKAGPLSTKSLDEAWDKFNRIAAMASEGAYALRALAALDGTTQKEEA